VFEGLFTALRDEGVPVALDEWLMLHDALERDLHHSTLSGFYLMSRAVLVKDESHYDGFDVAFARYFSGIEPADDAVDDRVWKWLHENPRFLHISEDQRARLDAMREPLPCWSAFTEGHVTADGYLSACCFDADGRWRMGDLKRQSFMEAWNSPEFIALRRAHLKRDVTGTPCEECVAYAG